IMLKKIGKAFVYLYVTLPLKGIAGNLGYKHLKNDYEFNKQQYKSLKKIHCPACFKSIVQTSQIKLTDNEIVEHKAPAKAVKVTLKCANPECSFENSFISGPSKKEISEKTNNAILAVGRESAKRIFEVIPVGQVNNSIKEHYEMAIMLRNISIFCVIGCFAFTFYQIFFKDNSLFFTALSAFSWLVIGLGIFLNALKYSHKSWQAQTLKVFEQQSQFYFWFKNHAWFSKPKYWRISGEGKNATK
ncbi:hypothetical protein QJ497_18680, partial [Acinetobacter baumannii]